MEAPGWLQDFTKCNPEVNYGGHFSIRPSVCLSTIYFGVRMHPGRDLYELRRRHENQTLNGFILEKGFVAFGFICLLSSALFSYSTLLTAA
jgi:hypothetical protein